MEAVEAGSIPMADGTHHLELPIAHMVALSFNHARILAAFKTASLALIHKGKGETVNSPSSHRLILLYYERKQRLGSIKDVPDR